MYQTNRLLLRTAKEVSVEDVLDYYRDNREHLKPYEPEREESFYSFREQSIQLAYEVEHLQNSSGLKLYVSKHNMKRIIGIINFSQIVMGGFCSSYVGYGLDHRYLKQGYMNEALKFGITLMFNQYNLHRLEGNVMPRNVESIHVLEQLGFEAEGLAKKYLKINGVWEDHIHYVKFNE